MRTPRTEAPSIDWRAAASAAGLDIRSVTVLSGAGGNPAARVTATDGRVLKLRAFGSRREALGVARLLDAAGGRDLPALVGRAGHLLALEFVPGTRLDRHLGRAPSREARRFIRAAGRLLARLHAIDVPRGVRRGRLPIYRWLISTAADALEQRGWLASDAADKMRRLTTPHDPSTTITHGDLCPENLIIDARGRLRAIDEERLAVRPAAFDVARTITRWPLALAGERDLLESYARAGGDAEGYGRARLFWLAAAFATSVVYRLRCGLPGTRTAARRLAAHLRTN